MAWGKGFLVFALGYAVGRWVLPDFYPFLFALMFSGMIEPIVRWLERRGVPRTGGALLAIAGVIGLSGWVFFLAVGGLWSESVTLLRRMPDYYRVARQAIEAAGGALGLFGPGRLPVATGEGPLRSVFGFLTSALGEIARGAAHVPEAALGLGVAVIAAYFLTKDRPKIALAARRVVPAAVLEWGREVGTAVVGTCMGYIRAQLILVAATAVLTTLGLLILGNRYAIVLGLATGALDILPVMGPTTVLLPWGVFLLAAGHIAQGIRILALLVVVAGTREVLEMKVVGGQVGLHPVAALAAMYLGVRLFGALGIALGPILVAAAWSVAAQGRTGKEVYR